MHKETFMDQNASNSAPTLAYEGIRIFDASQGLAGPYCAMLFAQHGATVIKLEPPQGDATRGQLRDVPGADSLYFTMLNCNKRSITVNMKSPEGRQVFADLIARCDIMMENFGPGVLDRLGFAWERIHQINPKLVMGSIKGFGSSGPYADFKAYENVAQAMGGAMSTTGIPDGPPYVTGAQIGEFTAILKGKAGSWTQCAAVALPKTAKPGKPTTAAKKSKPKESTDVAMKVEAIDTATNSALRNAMSTMRMMRESLGMTVGVVRGRSVGGPRFYRS
jgi:hypothetical protein